MAKRKKKRELSLIEGLVEDSKELISVKNVIHMAREFLFRVAKCKYKPIDSKHDAIKSIIFEYELRRDELERHMATMLKVAYSHQYEIKFDRYHLSTPEMQAGHAYVTIHKNKESRRAVLFLTDVTVDFQETIKAGEIRVYNEELESIYLSHCPPVWSPDSFVDMHLERLKTIIK